MRLLRTFLLSTAGSAAGFVSQPCSTYCKAGGLNRSSRSAHTPNAPRQLSIFICHTSGDSVFATSSAVTRRRSTNRLCIARGDDAVSVLKADSSASRDNFVAGAAAAAEQNTRSSTASTTSTSQLPPPDESAVHDALLPLLLLNVVTVLWGTQHAVIKLILQGDLSPGITNLSRFGLAALLFSPWTPGLFRNPPPLPFSQQSTVGAVDVQKEGVVTTSEQQPTADAAVARDEDGFAGVGETWMAGAELGGWMFLGFAFQAVGLGFTTASRSAFLLYLNVKLVPFFAYLLEGRRISIPTWISAILAFVGTVLLSSDGTPPNIGDLWSVLAAATSAMFILRLEKYSGRCEASQLNSANLWVTTGLCTLWAAWELLFQGLDPSLAIEGIRTEAPLIAYLAVVTTALTNWLQALGQRSVPAERAAIIYAMDPVYAAGFAYLVLGETLGPTGLAGAATITGAALWSQGQQATEGGDLGGDTENLLQKSDDGDSGGDTENVLQKSDDGDSGGDSENVLQKSDSLNRLVERTPDDGGVGSGLL